MGVVRRMMQNLADLMELDKEELTTIESIYNGVVHTLALKTHIGMSISVFRYFAECCDKIPIGDAKSSRNRCYTRPKLIGVCGMITPLNYQLMMISSKLSRWKLLLSALRADTSLSPNSTQAG